MKVFHQLGSTTKLLTLQKPAEFFGEKVKLFVVKTTEVLCGRVLYSPFSQNHLTSPCNKVRTCSRGLVYAFMWILDKKVLLLEKTILFKCLKKPSRHFVQTHTLNHFGWRSCTPTVSHKVTPCLFRWSFQRIGIQDQNHRFGLTTSGQVWQCTFEQVSRGLMFFFLFPCYFPQNSERFRQNLCQPKCDASDRRSKTNFFQLLCALLTLNVHTPDKTLCMILCRKPKVISDIASMPWQFLHVERHIFGCNLLLFAIYEMNWYDEATSSVGGGGGTHSRRCTRVLSVGWEFLFSQSSRKRGSSSGGKNLRPLAICQRPAGLVWKVIVVSPEAGSDQFVARWEVSPRLMRRALCFRSVLYYFEMNSMSLNPIGLPSKIKIRDVSCHFSSLVHQSVGCDRTLLNKKTTPRKRAVPDCGSIAHLYSSTLGQVMSTGGPPCAQLPDPRPWKA